MKTSKKTNSQRVKAGAQALKARTVIRPFNPSDAEYADIIAIENANYPDQPMAVSEFRFYDETGGEGTLQERLVAERGERIVGFVTYGQPWWSLREGKFFVWLSVDPDWHNTSVPRELYDAALKTLRPYHPQLLTTEFREDQDYLVELFERDGFAVVQRNASSLLDLASFDDSPFMAICDQVRAAGIRIDDLAAVAAEDAEWQRKVWDLEWQVLQDLPVPDELTRVPFDEWLKRTFEAPTFIEEAYLLAREGDDYVGMSSLWKTEADQTKLHTGLTGVLRSHRRRGIATALKVRGLEFAKEYGAEVIEADNEENNPMLAINKQLGFTERPAYLILEKRMPEQVENRKTVTNSP